MSNNQKHRDGFVCKLKAMDWFVSKGYWIFDETNQGPIDFIAVNIEGDIQFVECKKLAIRQGEWKPGTRINRVLSYKQKQILDYISVNAYDIIVANSGGHPCITNISGINYLGKDGNTMLKKLAASMLD